MNIFYRIDDFLRPSYQIVGAAIEWTVLLLITLLIVLILWYKCGIRKLWHRTWLWDWLNWIVVRYRFKRSERRQEFEFICCVIIKIRDRFKYREKAGRPRLITQGYYERMFEKAEAKYGDKFGC